MFRYHLAAREPRVPDAAEAPRLALPGAGEVGRRRARAVARARIQADLGPGRVVVSEKEAPNMLARYHRSTIFI